MYIQDKGLRQIECYINKRITIYTRLKFRRQKGSLPLEGESKNSENRGVGSPSSRVNIDNY